jgi:hypothetical protein
LRRFRQILIQRAAPRLANAQRRAEDSTPYHFTYQSHAGKFLRTHRGVR